MTASTHSTPEELRFAEAMVNSDAAPVSYTHLTLPTKA